MDFLEPFYLVCNLTVFSTLILQLIPNKKESFKSKFKIFSLYLLFFCLFYIFFSGQRNSINGIIFWKSLLFSHWFILFIIGISLATFFLVKKNFFLTLKLVLPLSGCFIFFLFFGQEKFQIFHWSFSSLGLLKSQNPVLFVVGFPLLWIPFYKLRTFTILVLGIFLAIYTQQLKQELFKKLETARYYKYIPPEIFFSGYAILKEEEMGVYEFLRPTEVEEPIYKFTMKPLRKLSLSDRLLIQEIISSLEFPIVIFQENKIYIYELYRSFRGNSLKIIYSVDSRKVEIEGPLF